MAIRSHSSIIASAFEPGTWCMLIVGFVFLAAYRRRSRCADCLGSPKPQAARLRKESSVRGKFFSVAVLCLSAVSGPALAAPPYSAIYSFGDSLSDVGNVYDGQGIPYAPYSNGRFSNGPNWLDDLSAKLGLGAVTASSTGGHDFAWGGAVTGYPGTDNPVFPFPIPTLGDQVSKFLMSPVTSPSTALYTFSIGANDLFGMLADPNLDPADIPTDIAGAAAAVGSAAADLAQAGATSLLLFDVPNLGLVPEVTGAGVLGLPELATQLSAEFNTAVLADISAAAPSLTVFDIGSYGLLTEAVAHPAEFGFTDTTTPCWSGSLEGYLGPGSACSEQDQHLFWDSEHPTEAGHALIADAALRAIGAPVPEASTWAMMLLGFASVGYVGYRSTRRAATVA
jgi:phospholipase/lecithinase/hemolysin